MRLFSHYRAGIFRRLLAASSSLLAFGAIAHAQDDNFKVTFYSGVDYSNGDYGDALDTEILYVPVSAKATFGEWALRASSGYINIKGPGSVIGGGNGGVIVTPGRGGTQITEESGLGDTYLSLIYSPTLIDGEIFLDFTAKVKVPTADESRGLGTGKADVTLQADVSKFIGPVLPFARIGYRFVGRPDSFTLKNTLIGSVGAAYYFSNKSSIGASLDYKEAASPLADDSKEIFAYFDVKSTRSWGVVLYGIAGLSDGSPDFGAGVQLKVTAY